jgi:hypothetical protein
MDRLLRIRELRQGLVLTGLALVVSLPVLFVVALVFRALQLHEVFPVAFYILVVASALMAVGGLIKLRKAYGGRYDRLTAVAFIGSLLALGCLLWLVRLLPQLPILSPFGVAAIYTFSIVLLCIVWWFLPPSGESHE